MHISTIHIEIEYESLHSTRHVFAEQCEHSALTIDYADILGLIEDVQQ